MGTSGSNFRNDKSRVFETVLSSPGMSDTCKITFRMKRQNVLLLCRVIETGIFSSTGNSEDEILATISAEAAKEFKEVQEEILQKAGLADFYEKLKLLQP